MRFLILCACSIFTTVAAAEDSRSVASGLFGDLSMVLVLILGAALWMKWSDAARQERRADAAIAQVIELQKDALDGEGQRAIQNKRAIDILSQAISVQEQATQVISENTQHMKAVNRFLASYEKRWAELERSAG